MDRERANPTVHGRLRRPDSIEACSAGLIGWVGRELIEKVRDIYLKKRTGNPAIRSGFLKVSRIRILGTGYLDKGRLGMGPFVKGCD